MNEKARQQIVIWLIVVCVLIFSMVVLGGVTRLTHSGLSIVDWQPIMGTLPPLNEVAWQESFEKYQSSPEYQKINRGMSLSQFQSIFFWEYCHRLLGRLIGIVFIVPYLIFLIQRKLKGKLAGKVLIGFLLGGLEGLMGWYMVKSGLISEPRVSHYRLAAHLAIAFLIFAYLFWIILDLLPRARQQVTAKMRSLVWISIGITAGICLEVLYGAFTAGLKAGYGFNTFPKMGDVWVPAGILQLQPLWLNFLENGISIQFTHRILAWLLAAAVVLFWIYARKFPLNKAQRSGLNLLLAITAVQFLLGVQTLISFIPISLATLHQAGAFLLFAVALFVNYSFARS